MKGAEGESKVDITTQIAGKNTSLPPGERPLNKDFGFKGVQINNDAYLDVN